MDTRLVRAAWAWLSNDDLDGVVGPCDPVVVSVPWDVVAAIVPWDGAVVIVPGGTVVALALHPAVVMGITVNGMMFTLELSETKSIFSPIALTL